MKAFYSPFLLLILSGCVISQVSTGSTLKPLTSPKQSALQPEECAINAKVLREEAPGIYSLRVYQVTEVGYGHELKVTAGDKIQVHTPAPLLAGKTVDIIVVWVQSEAGGYFEMKTGAI